MEKEGMERITEVTPVKKREPIYMLGDPRSTDYVLPSGRVNPTMSESTGKEVSAHTHGHAKYNRTTGDVILPDGMYLNQKLVKQRWWYRQDAPSDADPHKLEK